ncbi:MAG: transketolase C-terminal domain-containing protein [bacterium]|nr:transketolase C-terminal domain-containing protein [bacterium]
MNRYEELLLDLVNTDERIIILTAENRGHMRTIPAHLGKRFMDVGIAEQTMIGAAAGLAVRGRIVLTHALASFVTLRPFEFIRDDVGIPNLSVIMVGMVPGFLSDGNGPTHQAVDDVGLMRGIPNVGVFCPADEDDFIIGMRDIILSERPFYVRYINTPACVEHDKNFSIGKAEIVKGQGMGQRDITILTYGLLLKQSMQAAEILESHGLSVQVVNMRTLKPIDTEVLLNAAAESSLVVTVEDHFKNGGLYSILAETVLDNQTPCRALAIALEERWFRPALLADVLEYEGFTGEQIAVRIQRALELQPKDSYAELRLS